jgi:hypothetical protein
VAPEVTSLAQFVATYGGRDRPTRPSTTSWTCSSTRAAPGLIVARYAGPAAAKATRNLLDGSAGVALTVAAKGVGSYGNSITVQVTHPTAPTSS